MFVSGMLFIFVVLIIMFFILKKLFLYAADNPDTFLGSAMTGLGNAMTESGLGGAAAVFGVLIYTWNLLLWTYNSTAYGNTAFLPYLPYVYGTAFLLAVIISFFGSLRGVCITGLVITLGTLTGGIIVSFVLNSAAFLDQSYIFMSLVLCLGIAIVGPLVFFIGTVVFTLLGTIGIFGPLFLILLSGISGLLMPSASTLVSFFGGAHQNVPIPLTDFSLKAVLILFVLFGIAMLVEKRPRKD